MLPKVQTQIALMLKMTSFNLIEQGFNSQAEFGLPLF